MEMSSLPLMYLRALERYMSAGARVVRPHVDVDNTKDLEQDRTGLYAEVKLVMMGVKPTSSNRQTFSVLLEIESNSHAHAVDTYT